MPGDDPLSPTTGYRWVSWREQPGNPASPFVPAGTKVRMQMTRHPALMDARNMTTGDVIRYDDGSAAQDISIVGKIEGGQYDGEERQFRGRKLSTVKNPESLFAALVKAQAVFLKENNRRPRPGDYLTVLLKGMREVKGQPAGSFIAKFELGTLPEPEIAALDMADETSAEVEFTL